MVEEAWTRATALRMACLFGRSPLMVRNCVRIFAQGCFNLLRNIPAFADWKGLMPLGWTVAVYFMVRGGEGVACYSPH